MLVAIILLYMAFAIGAVVADQDCCYWLASAMNTQQFQVSWQASTQTPSCTFLTYGSQWTSQCTANSTVIDGEYLAVSAIMTPPAGPQFNYTFGMNNNDCKPLGDDQVQIFMAPVGWGGVSTDWSSQWTSNQNKGSQCPGSIIV